MALRLYLDDCAFSHRLAQLLMQAGHEVTTPVQAGISKRADPVHFDFAVAQGLILVTKNPLDFFRLHQSKQIHPGILAIYQDNDPHRDMNYGEIVDAIGRLEQTYAQSETSLANAFHVLNQWRATTGGADPVVATGE